MKKLYKVTQYPVFLIVLAGCTETSQTEQAVTNRPDTAITRQAGIIPIIESGAGCYQMIIGRDTADMQLTQSNDSLRGSLTYKRFEKDDNEGAVSLRMHDSKAFGWYRFGSEGKVSMRQIIFKFEKNRFEEAYGDVVMRGDSVFYEYPATLRFEDKHPFKKISCQ